MLYSKLHIFINIDAQVWIDDGSFPFLVNKFNPWVFLTCPLAKK